MSGWATVDIPLVEDQTIGTIKMVSIELDGQVTPLLTQIALKGFRLSFLEMQPIDPLLLQLFTWII